jgi:hypothetical protein
MWSDQDRSSGDVNRKLNRAIKSILKQEEFVELENRYRQRSKRQMIKAIYQYLKTLEFPDKWGWKLPETYLIAPLVLEILPDARIIHLIRDGRDLAFKKHLTDDSKRLIGIKILKHIGALDKPI